MDKQQAIETVWDYMHMEHDLVPADIIFILGSFDPLVAERASDLYHQGFAPWVVISGDGTQHQSEMLRNKLNGKTEAEVLSSICVNLGVPAENILLEDEANNTGQNFEFITPILANANLTVETCIAVQKPFMERRTYATGKVWWPDVDLRITSPSGTFKEYVAERFNPDDIINIMIGDLERIREYPKQGFQIKQDIPDKVTEAFDTLVAAGYSKHLL